MNESAGVHVAAQVAKLMNEKRIHVFDTRILILGLTFKEHCADLRKTRIVEIVNELNEYHFNVDVFDPWVNKEEAKGKFGLDLIDEPPIDNYDVVKFAVAHDQFKNKGIETKKSYGKAIHLLYDIKYLFQPIWLMDDCIDGI